MTRSIPWMILLCCLHALGQQPVLVPGEPANLDGIKKQLTAYHDCKESTCYTAQLDHQADLALGFLKQSVASAKPGEKLAIVLDIDETSLSNWAAELHDDLAFIANDWNWCASLRCGKVIPSTLRIYQAAKADKVAVFFITGRPESERADTEANLRAEGYDGWDGLALRAVTRPPNQTVTLYKSGERQKIVESGYRVVLNVGDQLSDLNGDPQADHSVKLPNPFYLIP